MQVRTRTVCLQPEHAKKPRLVMLFGWSVCSGNPHRVGQHAAIQTAAEAGAPPESRTAAAAHERGSETGAGVYTCTQSPVQPAAWHARFCLLSEAISAARLLESIIACLDLHATDVRQANGRTMDADAPRKRRAREQPCWATDIGRASRARASVASCARTFLRLACRCLQMWVE